MQCKRKVTSRQVFWVLFYINQCVSVAASIYRERNTGGNLNKKEKTNGRSTALRRSAGNNPYNRMRQIVASYCIPDLHWPWSVGEAYFARYLIDYDPASNVGNLLYIAGSGADPRSGRHSNIEKQQEMYDADHAYTEFWGERA